MYKCKIRMTHQINRSTEPTTLIKMAIATLFTLALVAGASALPVKTKMNMTQMTAETKEVRGSRSCCSSPPLMFISPGTAPHRGSTALASGWWCDGLVCGCAGTAVRGVRYSGMAGSARYGTGSRGPRPQAKAAFLPGCLVLMCLADASSPAVRRRQMAPHQVRRPRRRQLVSQAPAPLLAAAVRVRVSAGSPFPAALDICEGEPPSCRRSHARARLAHTPRAQELCRPRHDETPQGRHLRRRPLEVSRWTSFATLGPCLDCQSGPGCASPCVLKASWLAAKRWCKPGHGPGVCRAGRCSSRTLPRPCLTRLFVFFPRASPYPGSASPSPRTCTRQSGSSNSTTLPTTT